MEKDMMLILNKRFWFAYLELVFSGFKAELNDVIFIDPGLDTSHMWVKWNKSFFSRTPIIKIKPVQANN